MSAWGVAGGVLALIALESLGRADTGRVSGLFSLVQSGATRLLDPTVAGIPNKAAALHASAPVTQASGAAAGQRGAPSVPGFTPVVMTPTAAFGAVQA